MLIAKDNDSRLVTFPRMKVRAVSVKSLAWETRGELIGRAKEVADDLHQADADTLDLLTRLTERSMLAVRPQAGGSTRYELLETLREYGRTRLSDARAAELFAEHARHFADHLPRFRHMVQGIARENEVERLISDPMIPVELLASQVNATEWTLAVRLARRRSGNRQSPHRS